MLHFFHKKHLSINTLDGIKINLSKNDSEYVQGLLAQVVWEANVPHVLRSPLFRGNFFQDNFEGLYLHNNEIAICVKTTKKQKHSLEKPHRVFIADFAVDSRLVAQLVDIKQKKYNSDILKIIVPLMAGDHKDRVGFSLPLELSKAFLPQISFKKAANEVREFLEKSESSHRLAFSRI